MLPEAGKVRRSWRDGWPSALCRSRQPPDSKQQKQRRLALGCLLSLVAATLLLASSGVVGWLVETPMRNPGRVLLVTAHPDDEVIFFASTVTALHSSGLEVFLLCLTNGSAPVPAPYVYFIVTDPFCGSLKLHSRPGSCVSACCAFGSGAHAEMKSSDELLAFA